MATVNPSVLRAVNTEAQNLFTITHPYADIVGLAISDVSKAEPAVVTAAATLPGTFVDGTKIIITGVEGMTELATAGVDGSNEFYVGVIDATTFGLYTDVALQVAVDSSAFTTATADTGTFQIFTVTQYESVGSTATAQFNSTTNGYGTAIDIDFATGHFQVTGGTDTYQFVATATVSSPGATYQWYDFTNSATVGTSAPVGFPVTGLFKNDADAEIGLVVTASEGTTFQYPAQITDIQAVATVVSGFVA